ncbi:MAG: cell division protein ZipA C-terminal FtsZ-binding domain-containing protein [Gammaproteobacteria bacterium]|jgi:cell division protein ZipA|nr:cell division protein ZipA C-terminal FtsZ-binding domain-containing protein [Gammaproteobacteria bacterium]
MMSAWEFRWVLLGLGVVILVVIYLLSRREHRQSAADLFDEEDLNRDSVGLRLGNVPGGGEPTAEEIRDGLGALRDAVHEERARSGLEVSPAGYGGEHDPVGHGAGATTGAPGYALTPPQEPAAKAPRPSPDAGPKISRMPNGESRLLAALHVVPDPPKRISGPDIVDSAQRIGLDFSPDGVFEWNVEMFGKPQPLFALADINPPGTFSEELLKGGSTPGLSLFILLPGPKEGLKAFNIMLEIAQTLAARFNARLLDDARNELSTATIEHLRDQIQLFSLRHTNVPSRKGNG